MPPTVLSELIVALTGVVFSSESGYKAFGTNVKDPIMGDVDFDKFTQWQTELLNAAQTMAESFSDEEDPDRYESALDDFESLLEQVLPQRPE